MGSVIDSREKASAKHIYVQYGYNVSTHGQWQNINTLLKGNLGTAVKMQMCMPLTQQLYFQEFNLKYISKMIYVQSN